MKKHIQKSSFKAALIAIALIGATSCTDSKKPKNTKDIAEEYNEARFDNTAKEKDSEFLVEAAEIHLEEIQLGQLAQQNSNTNDIKELGEMMEKEHRQSLADLTALANKKMIAIPTSLTDESKDSYAKLNKKIGNEFNNDYCKITIKKHKDAIDLFETASTECSDSEVREWASSTLPALRAHLDHAVACQKKSEIRY